MHILLVLVCSMASWQHGQSLTHGPFQNPRMSSPTSCNWDSRNAQEVSEFEVMEEVVQTCGIAPDTSIGVTDVHVSPLPPVLSLSNRKTYEVSTRVLRELGILVSAHILKGAATTAAATVVDEA